ncbi:hypothetical protein [Thalassoroseus pseudoceratinae]|uniref:hypothetical protein n=1 Tax=Thalassoroseus pseudoceratinae TaxID=2713176 RepID=UPI0014215226|nr:hypothetical protein [Thalassoroseus pseudoceratinae]
MSEPKPYLRMCPCCGQGMIRIAACDACNDLVAICDECEAVWKEPSQLKQSTSLRPDAQHPQCPHCGHEVRGWRFLTSKELQSAGQSDLIGGQSP